MLYDLKHCIPNNEPSIGHQVFAISSFVGVIVGGLFLLTLVAG